MSFHALRHTHVSLLKTASIGEPVALDLVGHNSAEMCSHYTHIDHVTRLDAVNRLKRQKRTRAPTPSRG